MLAVGGHQKAALALSNGKQCVLGPHIGDLDSLSGRERFLQQVNSFTELFGCEPQFIVHDLHPDYFTTVWAEQQSQPKVSVQHHHAHVVAGMLEHAWLDRTVLGVAFDGTGYGTDGTIWGGECLISTPTTFQRVAHLRPFALPGGEMAVRQPWRIALSLLTDAVGSAKAIELLHDFVDPGQLKPLATLVERGRSGPIATSAGRLFDGVSALLLSQSSASYEGELAMRLESICNESIIGSYLIPLREHEQAIWLDWQPLLLEIVEELFRGVEVGAIAMRFHRGLAQGIASVAQRFQTLPVVLSGGCFQNRLLTRLVQEELAGHPQPLGLPGLIPCNDGGLAAGQLAIAAAQLADPKFERGQLPCA